MELAGRVDVKHRNREYQAARQATQPAEDPGRPAKRPAADGMVAVIDRLEQRRQVSPSQGLDGRRDQNQRLLGPPDRLSDQGVKPSRPAIKNQGPRLGGPPHRFEPGNDRREAS